jgi:hypothetical protein
MVYWVLQLKLHDDNGEENQDTTAHSFLMQHNLNKIQGYTRYLLIIDRCYIFSKIHLIKM